MRSPLELYLPSLNLGLCLVLELLGRLTIAGEDFSFAILGAGNLPVVVYGAVLISKSVMASVDPEKELRQLKYDYKGA